jgi:predicted transcriptional regulator YdeE
MSSIHHKTLHDPIAVAGFQIRTSNAEELAGNGKIEQLWRRFFVENLGAQIPNRATEDLYVVYSNYESDENGAYDYLLGSPVTSIDNLPAGMTYAAIPAGDYAVVTTEKGPVKQVMQSAWRRIWSLSTAELGGRRSYLTDYEVYDHRAANPADAQVEIHLGLQAEL